MNSEIEKIIKSCGVELYDTESVMENGHKIFRVFISSREGVALEKCEEISRILSPIFDLNPPVQGQYYLEVSSPGIERVLKFPRHFKASIGEKVSIKLASGIDVRGEIKNADDESLCIENENGETKILYSDIKKAKTYFEW